MDPLTAKLGTSSIDHQTIADKQPVNKIKSSRFDDVRNAVSSQEQASKTKAADAAAAPTTTGAAHQISTTSQRPNTMPAETMRDSRSRIDQLKNRVDALGKSPSLSSLRTRLAQLDTEYQRVGAHVDAASISASPQQLIKLQKDMYQLSENINIVSKMVDQATSSVKSILQTQV